MSFNIQTCASLKFKGYASLVHSDFTHKYMYILSLPYHIKEIVREREKEYGGGQTCIPTLQRYVMKKLGRGGLFSRCKNRHNVGIENGWKIF